LGKQAQNSLVFKFVARTVVKFMKISRYITKSLQSF